ncbi:hypothetical protein [Streptomyces sp. JH34]|uniref:hypothetical protein n=1 Tax=unclassified Streptomyces TaxID=2593676 RepID=UPI0023F8BC05|nr:hypothetical protein [Streptomyces sp. JH34]MDF6021486.1 hypothetical protein [Streptomyces sp. JH34]
MTAAHTFAWSWSLGWTLLVLPLSLALLRGRGPAWLLRRATPRMVRMRGVGGLILWASAVTSAVFPLVGASTDAWYPVRTLAGPVAVLVAIVLVGVTDVAERRRRGKALPTSQ